MCGAASNYSTLQTLNSLSFLICKMGSLPFPHLTFQGCHVDEKYKGSESVSKLLRWGGLGTQQEFPKQFVKLLITNPRLYEH